MRGTTEFGSIQDLTEKANHSMLDRLDSAGLDTHILIPKQWETYIISTQESTSSLMQYHNLFSVPVLQVLWSQHRMRVNGAEVQLRR